MSVRKGQLYSTASNSKLPAQMIRSVLHSGEPAGFHGSQALLNLYQSEIVVLTLLFLAPNLSLCYTLCLCLSSHNGTMLQWDLAFSQVVWLLGLLNCSNCTKHIHEIGNKTISLISLLLQEMKNILRGADPARLPRHMHLDLSQHVMRNGSRFRLRAQTLKVETAAWDTWNTLLCDRCFCDEIQDETHALLVCRDADVCALRRKHAYLFDCSSGDFSMEQPYLQQVSVQA
eukprot:1139392-Pelagomonas_calceolata.AAC.2